MVQLCSVGLKWWLELPKVTFDSAKVLKNGSDLTTMLIRLLLCSYQCRCDDSLALSEAEWHTLDFFQPITLSRLKGVAFDLIWAGRKAIVDANHSRTTKVPRMSRETNKSSAIPSRNKKMVFRMGGSH